MMTQSSSRKSNDHVLIVVSKTPPASGFSHPFILKILWSMRADNVFNPSHGSRVINPMMGNRIQTIQLFPSFCASSCCSLVMFCHHILMLMSAVMAAA